LYVLLLGGIVIGTWPMVVYVLSKLIVMMTTGLPAAATHVPILMPYAVLSGYYSVSSPLIARFFRQIPILRPILFVGCAFLLGLALTHTIVIHYLSSNFGTQSGAMIIGVGGILVTRIAMSWLFSKVPVASLARG
jgi:hypothetical protein